MYCFIPKPLILSKHDTYVTFYDSCTKQKACPPVCCIFTTIVPLLISFFLFALKKHPRTLNLGTSNKLKIVVNSKHKDVCFAYVCDSQ